MKGKKSSTSENIVLLVVITLILTLAALFSFLVSSRNIQGRISDSAFIQNAFLIQERNENLIRDVGRACFSESDFNKCFKEKFSKLDYSANPVLQRELSGIKSRIFQDKLSIDKINETVFKIVVKDFEIRVQRHEKETSYFTEEDAVTSTTAVVYNTDLVAYVVKSEIQDKNSAFSGQDEGSQINPEESGSNKAGQIPTNLKNAAS